MRSSVETYPRAAVERAMKVQEAILRAMARKLTWFQEAEVLGISDRQIRRWRERYQEHGYDGLMDRRRGDPAKSVCLWSRLSRLWGFTGERYFDRNVRHFDEKLREEHGFEQSYTWVKLVLQGAGLVAKARKRGVHRRRRERRPLPGRLLHIDGSRQALPAAHVDHRGHEPHPFIGGLVAQIAGLLFKRLMIKRIGGFHIVAGFGRCPPAYTSRWRTASGQMPPIPPPGNK